MIKTTQEIISENSEIYNNAPYDDWEIEHLSVEWLPAESSLTKEQVRKEIENTLESENIEGSTSYYASGFRIALESLKKRLGLLEEEKR